MIIDTIMQLSFKSNGYSTLKIVKVLVVALLCAIATSSVAQAQKIYFFVEAGKDLSSDPLTNVIVFNGDALYTFGVGNLPANRLRNNINYFEELYSFEGYVNTTGSEHFNSKYVLNNFKSDDKFDYYEGCQRTKSQNYVMRISKDKSEMRKMISGTWRRFVSIDKNVIAKSYYNPSLGSNGNANANNKTFDTQGNSYQGNNTNHTNNSYINGANYSNGSNTQPAKKFKCAYCNGTGRIERNDNAPASFGLSRANKKCNECGKIYDPTVFNHYHIKCGHCGGTGFTK